MATRKKATMLAQGKPRTIVYRNLRDHAATKWFHEELGEPWEVVAQYLGDKLTAVLNLRPSRRRDLRAMGRRSA